MPIVLTSMPKIARIKYRKTIQDLLDQNKRKERQVKIDFNKQHGKYGIKFISYAQRAWKKKMQFNLTLKDFIAIDTMSCIYCGGKPTGYDRIDNNVGYIRSNIVPCCPKCNMIKYTSSYQQFMDHICKIYRYNFNKR